MVAAAVVGSAVVGGAVSANAAKKGAKAQANAASQANETERYIYDQTREDQMPWQQAGNAGLNSLMGLYGFEQVEVPGTGSPAVPASGPKGSVVARGISPLSLNRGTPAKEAVPPEMRWQMAADPSGVSNKFMMLDPGYQFRLKEGQRGIENSAAARGGLMSGNFLKAAQQYGQDYASNEFANIANRYSALSGVGQSTNAQLQQAGQNYAGAYGQNVQNAGAARASGYAGQANAWTGAMSNALGGYGAYKNGYFG